VQDRLFESDFDRAVKQIESVKTKNLRSSVSSVDKDEKDV